MGGGMIGPDWQDGLSKHPPAWWQWPGRGRRVATHHRQVAQVDDNQRLLALLPRRNRIIYYVIWILRNYA
jgi:hypothetical protein